MPETATEFDDETREQYAREYEHRNDRIQEAIDAAAAASPAELDAWGGHTQAAEQAGVEPRRVSYALQHWRHLVKWRRAANAGPLDSDAVRSAYDDETMADMATDGAGGVSVPIEVELDQAFRMIKLLPGDLAATVLAQVIEQSDALPPSEVRRVLDR